MLPRFGLNRFDARSVNAFAADVRRAEMLGWDAAFQPDSQLRRRDTYVLMAAAACVTERILLATLLSNPVNRHPTVTASSIATVDELAPGRTLLGWGVGDTAVRLAGLKPARVAELEASTRLMRALLDGRAVDVGAREPARLPHHRPVPIWIAAAGRDPSTVGLGAVFHTVLVEDRARALTMGKSMAAGYYEYSPMLFDPPHLIWSGPDPEKLKRERNVFPDFHHAPDLEASGRAVDFLSDAAADAFCLRGGTAEIVKRLLDVLRAAPATFDYVCLHPIPNPASPDDPERGFMARVAREVLPSVRAALGDG